ncbi:methyltransferase domain-containing protein [Geomonas sp. Red32]|uniref:methyltransferase domain-containing protein n=1 Tax=Geomonas sp. Red32 TaxID=2912856 RepID=UPI00202CE13B|nr:methyltransferase domain-containing protein [Geomonas sp. Red32]MCM0082424.1 methyltransferase domain-containing protein [Geomonas sp. Red32]
MPFVPQKRTAPEFLDLPPESYGAAELEGTLADIRTINRYLGDSRAVVKHLSRMVAGRGSFSVLDIATGSADIPVAVVKWARSRGMRAEVTAVDINERTVDIARRETGAYPEIRLEVADGLSLPFADGSFDVVLCSKTNHHLTDEENVRLIKEMQRLARRGYLVMDLRRSWVAWFLIRMLSTLFTSNRLTRYDGPLSVLKSFTDQELASLARQAGTARFRVSREPFWLLVLAGEVG